MDAPKPRPIVVAASDIQRAKFPVIDIHNHFRGDVSPSNLEKIVKDMDALNIRIVVDAGGGSGERLKLMAEKLAKYPGRFVVFANLDLTNIDDSDWSKKAVGQLRVDYGYGARGLKVFRNLGIDVKDSKGQRIKLDDPRFDPIWAECARVKMPVTLQSGNGPLFPGGRGDGRSADREANSDAALAEQHRVFEKHPNTTFVNADLGMLGANLAELGKLMDQYPNMYVEIGSGIVDLGRQPRAARQWLIKYQNRVLFGKTFFSKDEYLSSFRIFETPDESFTLNRRIDLPMYGIDLPDFVLKKVYYQNAFRVMPALAQGFPK
jgi:predicted TIM-barrel fold metal-dependent hydrolase